MSSNRRLRSAGRKLGEFIPNSYPIFDPRQEEKDVAIWQPSGIIDDVSDLPNPEPGMKEKAEEFLNRANDNECHLAAAPEWAYDIHWVTDHADYLFSEDSPLFVLGCSPVRGSTRRDVIDALETDYEVHEADDVECNPGDLLTPTIVPIKAASRRESETNAVLVQYKNYPMSGGVNTNEHANLAEGEFVWKVNPRDAPTVVPLTCSDILDSELPHCVADYATTNDTFVVHVQCNPRPVHEAWIDFRNDIFKGGDMKVTYVCANWGRGTFDGKTSQLGYSGIYTKARNRPPLKNYDRTYRKGGLVGTQPRYSCDYIWLMPDDVMSNIQFKRSNPGTSGAAAPRSSYPQIVKTWSWDPEAGTYATATPGVPECEDPVCDRWRSELPESPLARELMTAIGLGKIDYEELPNSGANPEADIRWAAIETLTDTDGTERLGHVLADHARRIGTSGSIGKPPKKEAQLLVEGLDTAVEEGICMDDEFTPEDIPMNAEYEDKSVRVCLTVQDLRGGRERERVKWLHKMYTWRDDERFEPLVAAMDPDDGMVLERLEDIEDVSKANHDPERVDTAVKLVRINQ